MKTRFLNVFTAALAALFIASGCQEKPTPETPDADNYITVNPDKVEASWEEGIYDVTVRFIHDNYKTIRKDVTLTIMPASAEAYNGNELIVEDTEYKYNGERQYIVAKAPKGWTIEYVNNGRKNVGSHEVTVYFNHQSYGTITKTAVLTIEK